MSKTFNSKIYEEYIDKDNLPASLSRIEKLLEKKNDDLILLDVKAEILNLMDKTDEAISIYKEILYTDHEYMNAYIALSNLYLAEEIKKEKDNSEVIVDLLKKAEQINSDEVSYYVLADALKDSKRLDEAIEYYTKALKQEKNDDYFLESIWVELGRIYVEQEKYSLALNAYDSAIKCSTKENGDDSYCSALYVAEREIYSYMDNEDKVKEMDDKFASAENKYKEKPPHVYHGRLGEKFQDIASRLQKLGKQNEERRLQLFEVISSSIKDVYPVSTPNYEELNELIDFILDELDPDGTIFNKEVRALEKAYLIKLFNESHA